MDYLTDSAQGGRKTVSIGTHYGTQAVEIEIPQGINDGDTVQYPGLAPGGVDLLITYRIHPDPRWQRQGNNLVTDQTVSVWDCILGCEITIRDIFGNQLSLTVPARTNPGTMLRLRGKGMSQKNQTPGDLLIRIQCQMPNIIDQDLLDMIEKTRSNK